MPVAGTGLRFFIVLVLIALAAVVLREVLTADRFLSSGSTRPSGKKEQKIASSRDRQRFESYSWGWGDGENNATETERIAVLFKTTVPIHPSALRNLESMVERWHGDGQGANDRFSSDLIVLIDTTNREPAAVQHAYEQLASISLEKSSGRTLPVYEFNLTGVLSAYPELSYYLYERGSVEENTTGARCCGRGRTELWQVQILPLCLLQRDLPRLLPDYGGGNEARRRGGGGGGGGRRYKSYWLLQDDVEVYSVEGASANGSLSRFFSAQEERYPVDLLGYRLGTFRCPGRWHKHRHTAAFADILSRMKERGVEWLCVSEGAMRLSDSLLEWHGRLARKYVWSFGETLYLPVAWATNHSVHLEVPSTMYDGLPPFHHFDRTERDEIFNSTLYGVPQQKQVFDTYMLHVKK